MKTVKVKPNQSLFDLAAEHYGTLEALSELLENNPDLENDASALNKAGVSTMGTGVPFRLDVAVKPNFPLRIDETSRLMDGKIIQKINNEITTYETWQTQSKTSRKR